MAMDYLRGHPCVYCGETDPVVLEFDHCGEKRDAISSMLRWQTSWNAVEKKIFLCAVRCANCHHRKTARERGWLKAKLQAAGSDPRRGKF